MIKTFSSYNKTHFKEGQSMSSYSYKTDFDKNFIPEQKYNIYGTTIDHLIETQTLIVLITSSWMLMV